MKTSYTYDELHDHFKDYDLIDLPTWSLPAIVNGDYSGLSEEDEENIDDYIEVMHNKGFNPDCFSFVEITNSGIKIIDDPQEYFMNHPAFGEPSGCYKVFYAY